MIQRLDLNRKSKFNRGIYLTTSDIDVQHEGGGEMKPFAEKAYDLLRKVPAGRVTTYKEIAHGLGTKAYRGIGQAMKRNPYAPEVP